MSHDTLVSPASVAPHLTTAERLRDDLARDDAGAARPHHLRVAGEPASTDLEAAAEAVRALLRSLGQNPDSDGLRDTPRRVARSFAEMLTPTAFDLTTFVNDENYDGLVLARDISFHSLCEHHLLPFQGVAHVAYLPGDRIVGLSKLARLVDHFSRRLQVQERLTQQIADSLQSHLRPRGVAVVIEAEHQCMSLRGVRARGACTRTSALHGSLRDDPDLRGEFFSLVRTTP